MGSERQLVIEDSSVTGGSHPFQVLQMALEKKLAEENSSVTGGRTEEGNDGMRYLKLISAINSADWTTAKKFFDEHPDALTACIAVFGFTALHIAVTSRGNITFVQKLLDLMVQNDKPFGVQSEMGHTALHCAAMAGNTKAAQMLVERDPKLTLQKDNFQETPLFQAAKLGHEETVRYLLQIARIVVHDQNSFIGEDGASLLSFLVLDGFYDMAISVLEDYPALAVEMTRSGPTVEMTRSEPTALLVLATTPGAFSSGSQRWQHLSYYVVTRIFANRSRNAPSGADAENPIDKWKTVLEEFCLFVFLKDVHEKELRHKKVIKLLKSLIEKAINSNASKARTMLFYYSLAAAELGNHEFVREVIKADPALIYLVRLDTLQSIFDVAVINRQEKVFNLLFQTGLRTHFILHPDKKHNNLLHHAAKFHSSAQIEKIPGAALQMQREFQWFKEVEELVPPSFAVAFNDEKKTPAMLFAESHKDLVKEGEEWMRKTADSYTIVAALVVTIAFASAFTLPSIPISEYEKSFMVFAISNSVALFSSVTSLLMFLGILTSRYKQEDFLKALPMRLAIGLINLFLAIAATLVAFSASVYILLYHRVHWVAAPIALLAAVPVALYTLLHFPLLVEVVYSTFGPSIFRKGSDEMLF